MNQWERIRLAWALLRGRAEVVCDLTRRDQIEGDALLSAYKLRYPGKSPWWSVLAATAVHVPQHWDEPKSVGTITLVPVGQRDGLRVTVLRWPS